MGKSPVPSSASEGLGLGDPAAKPREQLSHLFNEKLLIISLTHTHYAGRGRGGNNQPTTGDPRVQGNCVFHRKRPTRPNLLRSNQAPSCSRNSGPARSVAGTHPAPPRGARCPPGAPKCGCCALSTPGTRLHRDLDHDPDENPESSPAPCTLCPNYFPHREN